MSVMRPAQELQLTVGVLDERRARLDPVPGVAIKRTVDQPQLIAVHDEETLAARGAVYPLAVDLKLSPQHLRHHGETRVVVAGDVNEPGAGSAPGEQRAHHECAAATRKSAARD